MKKKGISRDLKVGLIVIGAGLLLYFGLNFLKGINIFSSVNTYYVQYENIGGLVASSPVNIKGYKVGQVDNIVYDFSKKVPFTVQISIKKDIPLPAGTVIDLYDDGIMGGKAIQVLFPEQASSSSAYKSGDTIQSKTTVGLVEQLTVNLLPKIENIAATTDSIIQSVHQLMENGSIENTLTSLENMTADLESSSAKLKEMMSGDVPQVINKVDIIATDFAKITNELKQVDYQGTFSSIDSTVCNLKNVTRQLNNTEGTLGALLYDKSLYFNLLDATMSADSLLIDLQRNPKRYVHFSIFGKK